MVIGRLTFAICKYDFIINMDYDAFYFLMIIVRHSDGGKTFIQYSINITMRFIADSARLSKPPN